MHDDSPASLGVAHNFVHRRSIAFRCQDGTCKTVRELFFTRIDKCSPLQMRMSLRDAFDSPNAPVQKSLVNLNTTVGYDFSLVIAWVDIHRDLASLFPDISILVPSITGVLTSYLNRLITLLDDEKFQDAFLEKASHVSCRDIIIQVGEQTNEDKSFFDKSGKLTLSLPRTGSDWYRRMSSRVGHDLEALFTSKGASTTSTTSKPTSDKPASDWVDIHSVSSASNAVTSLPSIDTLGKPETMFTSLLPYYVVITNSGAHIHVQGSHQPTLDLVHNYFRMHTRKNMNLTTQVYLSYLFLILGTLS